MDSDISEETTSLERLPDEQVELGIKNRTEERIKKSDNRLEGKQFEKYSEGSSKENLRITDKKEEIPNRSKQDIKVRKGRPSNAERLKAARRDSTGSTRSLPENWFSKRARETDSDKSESDIEIENKQKRSQSKRTHKEERGKEEEGTRQKEIKAEEMEMLNETLKMIQAELTRIKEGQRSIEEKLVRAEKREKEKEERWEKEREELYKRIEILERRNEKVERRERKNNIVIKGLHRREGTVREKVEELMKEIEAEEEIQGIKEIKTTGEGERKIYIVKLEDFEKKKGIMQKKSKLKGKNIYIDDDMTWQEREMQRKIRERARLEREKGKIVKIKYSRMIINGKGYKWNELENRLEEENFQ